MFDYFKDIVEKRHEQAREFKSQGKKVIGYLCSYVPEELIYAAGAIPVRILSNTESPGLAEAHMQSYFCPFSRSLLHQIIKGDYDYLDGLVWGYTCITMRAVLEAAQRETSLPFIRSLHVPSQIDTSEAFEYYVKELRRFRKDLEDLAGHPITDDEIREAIEVYDTNRNLTKELFEFRKGEPLLSGKEAFQVTLSSMYTDKKRHNEELARLLKEIPDRPDPPQGMEKLMIVGSPIDNLEVLDLIENQLGAIVVADDSCTGTRYFYDATPPPYDGDPLEAITHRYLLSRAPCPMKYSPNRWVQCATCPYRAVQCFLMEPEPRKNLRDDISFPMPKRICRFRHILQLAASHKVEGVICLVQKFCDWHGADYPHIVQLFEKMGVPVLYLENENTFAAGQALTRVQAFLEMLEPVEYIIEEGILPGREDSEKEDLAHG
jgi:benzoyl-CoA reductase subunit C